MCLSWTVKCLTSLMHDVTMKILVMCLSNSDFFLEIGALKANIAYGVKEIFLYLPYFSSYFVIILYKRFTQTCGAVKGTFYLGGQMNFCPCCPHFSDLVLNSVY